MKKLLLCILILWGSFYSRAQLINLQVPINRHQPTGSTSSNPDDYVFQAVDKKQLVHLFLRPGTDPYPVDLYLQSGNCEIDFSYFLDVNRRDNFMSSLTIGWDNQPAEVLFENQSKHTHFGYVPPSFTGKHRLTVEFLILEDFTSKYAIRHYDVTFVEPATEFFMDDKGLPNRVELGNKLTVWEKPNGQAKIPMVIVEGFNPINSLSAEFYLNTVTPEFKARGYDNDFKFYFLDLGLNGQDMRNNAAVLNSAIKFISQENANQKVVVMGINMGGVIARYCLAKNEHDNKGILANYLPVSMFVSVDAPQQGMVFSLELLRWIHKEDPGDFTRNSQAAKQLFRGDNPFASGERQAFFDELNALNVTGYPSFCDNMGISLAPAGLERNPDAGQKWLTLDITPGSKHDHEDLVSGEETMAGSPIPPHVGKINKTEVPADFPLGVLLGTRHPYSPTLVPTVSALDIVQGKSKFCTLVNAEAATSYEEELPSNVVTQFVSAFKASTLNNVPTTRIYNFAAGTSGFITQDLTVEGKMFVNGNSKAGFDDAPVGPIPSGNSIFSVSTGCKVKKIDVKSGSELRLGAKALSTKGQLNVNDGELIIRTGGVLIIDENSKVVIGENAKFILEPFSIVRVLKGGFLTVDGLWDRSELAIIEILGGTVNLGGTNVLSMTPDFGLKVNDNGGFVMGERTTLNYAPGSQIKLNGGNSYLEVRGNLNLAANADFTFTADAGETPGFFRFNPGDYNRLNPDLSKFITAGAGATITLPQKGKFERALEIANSAYLPYELLRFKAENAGITILPGKELRVDAYDIQLVNASVNGGMIMLYPNEEPQIANVANSTFIGTTLSDFNSHVSTNRLVVSGCQFKNNAKLVENRAGVEVYDCTFEDNSGILISASRFVNRIENCVFSGTSNGDRNGNTAIDIRNSNLVTTAITGIGISGYSYGLKQDNFITSRLSCSNIFDNYVGVRLNIDASLNCDNGINSSNSIINQVATNFEFAFGNAPTTTLGGNEFYNSRTGGKIFQGTINNYFCKPGVNMVVVPRNCWKADDCSSQPQSATFDQTKVDLKGFDKVSCNYCGLLGADNSPKSKAPCVQLREPNIPLLPEVVKCPTCPLIFTSDFNGKNLAEAVASTNFIGTLTMPKTGNDQKALELYKQILTYPYYVKNQSTYKWLRQAYLGAKYAASELILNGKKEYAETQMYAIYSKFIPAQYSGHTELEIFLMELDKAEILHMVGRTDAALQVLSNVRASVDEPLLGQVDIQMDIYANDQAFIKGEISSTAYIQGMGNPGGIIFNPDPTKDCFELTTTLTPSAVTTLGDINFDQSGNSAQPGINMFQALSADGSPIEGQLVEVYPIPSTGEINLNFGSQVVDQVAVTNLFGKIVYSAEIKDATNASFDLSQLPKGVYLVKCSNAGDPVHTQKIILN